LKEFLESGEKIDRVIAVGPGVMMKCCAGTNEALELRNVTHAFRF